MDERERVMIEPDHSSTVEGDVRIVSRGNFVNINRLDAPQPLQSRINPKFVKWWNEIGKTVLKSVYGSNERKLSAVQNMYPLCRPSVSDIAFRGTPMSMPTNETIKLYNLHDQLLQRMSHSSQMQAEEMCNLMDSCVHKCDERMQEWKMSCEQTKQSAQKYKTMIETQSTFEGFSISDETRKRMLSAIDDELESAHKLCKSECDADIINIRAYFAELWPKPHDMENQQLLNEIEYERSRLNSVEHPLQPIQSIEESFQMQLGKLDENTRNYVSRRCERWLHTLQQDGSDAVLTMGSWKDMR